MLADDMVLKKRSRRRSTRRSRGTRRSRKTRRSRRVSRNMRRSRRVSRNMRRSRRTRRSRVRYQKGGVVDVANDEELMVFLESHYDDFLKYMEFSSDQISEIDDNMADELDILKKPTIFKKYVFEKTIRVVFTASGEVEIKDFVEKYLNLYACRALFRQLGITGEIKLVGEPGDGSLGTRGVSLGYARMMDGSKKSIDPSVPPIPDVDLEIPRSGEDKFKVIMDTVVQQYVNLFLQSKPLVNPPKHTIPNED